MLAGRVSHPLEIADFNGILDFRKSSGYNSHRRRTWIVFRLNPNGKHRVKRKVCAVKLRILAFVLLAVPVPLSEAETVSSAAAGTEQKFCVWAAGDSHVPRDFQHGRESLAKAIRQSEGFMEDGENGQPGFPWEIMIDVGDLSSSAFPPTEEDGRILVNQYRALKKHFREDIYNVPGNHDGMYYDQGPGVWFQKWADPLGRHTEFSEVDARRRRFPVVGDWERYKFQAGNILFLMLADRNSAPVPVGRGHSSEAQKGGFPAGAVTRRTFDWWKEQVLQNQDKIIITAHHHVLRNTTTRSNYGGGEGFHGHSGGVEGSGYLYSIIENEDPEDFQYTTSTPDHPGPFEVFLQQYQEQNGRPAIDLWIGGHSHAEGPEQVFEGKGLTEERWGVTFVQAAGLTVYHAGRVPISRPLSFSTGSDRLDIGLYVHDLPSRGQHYPLGWYEPASRTVTLRHPFQPPPPDTRGSPPVYEKIELPFPGELDDTPSDAGILEPIPKDGLLLVTEHPAWIARAKDGSAVSFGYFSRGLNLGYLDMEQWTDLTVTAWIETEDTTEYMRVLSKDRIGEKGNFVLCFNRNAWEFRVFDDRIDDWRHAAWASTTINDGRRHHLAAVVDSRGKKITLYVDSALKAQTDWTASALDDSDKTNLVVGADSRGAGIGHVFHGNIDDVRVFYRALSGEEIRALCEQNR